jgi:hypothetical protein
VESNNAICLVVPIMPPSLVIPPAAEQEKVLIQARAVTKFMHFSFLSRHVLVFIAQFLDPATGFSY